MPKSHARISQSLFRYNVCKNEWVRDSRDWEMLIKKIKVEESVR